MEFLQSLINELLDNDCGENVVTGFDSNFIYFSNSCGSYIFCISDIIDYAQND